MKEIIGFDITEDANDLRVVCVDCAENYDGEPLVKGEEWGGDYCECEKCGDSLDVTLVNEAQSGVSKARQKRSRKLPKFNRREWEHGMEIAKGQLRGEID